MTLVNAETGEIVALSSEEAIALVEAEETIERGLESFVEVGDALATVRDRRLYRANFGTFEDYCHEQWGLSRRHANRLVQAAEVVNELGPIGPKPKTESQARELAKAPPEERAEIMEEVGDEPTAPKIAEAVRKRQEPEPDEVWDEIEQNDEEIQAGVRRAQADKTVARISQAVLDAKQINPGDYSPESLRRLMEVGNDLAKFAGNAKARQRLTPINGGKS